MNEKQINAEYYLIEEFRQILDAQGLPVPEDSQEFRTDWLYQCCTLFPGFDGVAEAVKERRLWDRL
ncbi:MAG: hypothetical protein FJ266_10805 [Planctomycetes bacterium]|nr:hypothetical protein [Planctomycetota bacterium]